MGFFNNQSSDNGSLIQDWDAVNEASMLMELAAMSESERNAIMNSESYRVLEEKGLIGKKNRTMLTKSSDLERREMALALQLSREAGDPLFDKLAANRVKERDLLTKIRTKYNAKAKRAAVVQQRDYIKTIRQGGTITKDDLHNRA